MKMQIVKKVWGEERWLANADFCCKELILERGFRCSLHYHKKKDELFYVLEGQVLLEINGEEHVLSPGAWYRVYPNDIHRFNGWARSLILESSTHHEDEDSYRIEPSGRMYEH